MAIREPKPPALEDVAVSEAIEILKEHAQEGSFYAYVMPSEDQKRVLVSVCMHGELSPYIQSKIVDRITEAIAPLELSIHFVDQNKYHPPPAPS